MAEVSIERWKPHLEAAKAEGKSLSRYAQEHGLSRHTLYMANRELRRAGLGGAGVAVAASPKKAGVTNEFIPVQLVTSEVGAISLRVSFPNGIELHCNALSVETCTTLAGALALLPCSR